MGGGGGAVFGEFAWVHFGAIDDDLARVDAAKNPEAAFHWHERVDAASQRRNIECSVGNPAAVLSACRGGIGIRGGAPRRGGFAQAEVDEG
jgi:hypothetical protein